MAEEKENKKVSKKTETIRERAERLALEASKPSKSDTNKEEKKQRKSKKRGQKVKKEKKQRRFHIIPSFFRGAFAEIKLVTWPDRRMTAKLSTAVILFAVVFSVMIGLVDYAFGIIFKKVFLHG